MYIEEVLINVLDRIDELYHRKDTYLGIATGFNDVDDITLGLKPSDLIIIASRPSMGKTTFATNIVENIEISGRKSIAFYSLELSSENILMRMLSSITEITLRNFRIGRLSSDDFKTLISKVESIKNLPIQFFDSPTISISKICEQCKRICNTEGLDLVIIDDIQLLAMNEQSNREDAISEIAHKLKLLAVELNIPIIVISQLNRDLERRDNKRPVLSDLRGAGILSQLADIIFFIYRDEVYDEDSDDKGIVEIIIKKNRFGATGTVRLSFIGEFMKFDNLDSRS